MAKERIFESTLVIPSRKRPKSNKKSASASKKVKKPTGRRGTTTRNSPQKDGKAYDQARSQNPDRMDYTRRYQQKRRKKVKEQGICRDCPAAAIPNRVRCETCASKHQQAHRKAKEKEN